MAKGKQAAPYSRQMCGALTVLSSFVEFETAADLKTAVEKLDGREFKGARVACVPDVRFLDSSFGDGPRCSR